jgi:hypothetical protein
MQSRQRAANGKRFFTEETKAVTEESSTCCRSACGGADQVKASGPPAFRTELALQAEKPCDGSTCGFLLDCRAHHHEATAKP